MSIIKKSIPVILILFMAGILFLGYAYTKDRLKPFIYTAFERNFGATVSIGNIELRFPLALKLEDVVVNDTIKVGTVTIYPSLTSFLLNRKILLSRVKINDSVVRIVRERDSLSFLKKLTKKKKDGYVEISILPNVYFSKIDINNATLIYEDKESKLEFVKMKGVIENPGIYFSKNSIFQFSLTGFLKNKDSNFLSPFRIEGNARLDNTVEAKLRVNDIMLSSLKPLYLRQLGNIKGDRFDLESDIRIRGNNLMARCGLQIKDKDTEEINTPFIASFILLFNLKSKVLKIKNLQGDF